LDRTHQEEDDPDPDRYTNPFKLLSGHGRLFGLRIEIAYYFCGNSQRPPLGRTRREDKKGRGEGEERLIKDEEEKAFSRKESCFYASKLPRFSSRLTSLSLSLSLSLSSHTRREYLEHAQRTIAQSPSLLPLSKETYYSVKRDLSLYYPHSSTRHTRVW